MFLEKRLQLVENKGKECRKEDEEKERGCNRLRAKELKKERNTEGTEFGAGRPQRVHSREFCMDVKLKELSAKGFVSM